MEKEEEKGDEAPLNENFCLRYWAATSFS